MFKDALPVAISLLSLLGCSPNPDELSKQSPLAAANLARKVELCKDNAVADCPGKAPIKQEAGVFMLHKWNEQWFKVPANYSSYSGMSFLWPSRKPHTQGPSLPLGTDWSIQLLIRSYDIPPGPPGYRRIEMAEREGRVSNRVTLRPGLDRLEHRDIDSVTGKPSSFVFTEYVATNRRDPEGLPPVFRCKTNIQDPQQAGGGAGFMWRDGIWVEVLVRAGNLCEDWPELFDEVQRVLNLAEKVLANQEQEAG